jgi:hypothetical protein
MQWPGGRAEALAGPYSAGTTADFGRGPDSSTMVSAKARKAIDT